MSIDKKRVLRGLTAVGVVAVVAVVVLLTVFRGTDDGVDPKAFQAVLLDNNQMYFGHVTELDDTFLRLSDVYYVQVNQPADPDKKPSSKLVRLGAAESHGPENEMIINKSHVIFWENLRANAPIVQAIINLNLQTR